jgi:rhodanese-related sulfurtransferase
VTVSELKEISVEEAEKLLSEGYLYLDVRSEQEFEAGHVPGAFNVPLSHRTPQGPTANPDFLSVVERAFGKNERLIVACQAGGRAVRAALQMQQAGFVDLRVLGAGFGGARDAFGRPKPGWIQHGLPVEQGKPAGQSYDDVKRRAPADPGA